MNLGSLTISNGLPTKRGRFALLVIILFMAAGSLLLKQLQINPLCFCFSTNPDVLRVAHAGGGIDGVTYTNSIEALDLNYSKGFRYFEIDFNTTNDKTIVCLHDWALIRSDANIDSLEIPLSFTEFENINESIYDHKMCTLESLANWFNEHQDAFLITDVKDNNIDTLNKMVNRIHNASTVVIPQIYHPDEYAMVVAAGFEKVIWTIHRSYLAESQVLMHIKNMDRLIAVTMPVEMAQSSFPLKILIKGIAVYAHTVNDRDQLANLKKEFCVSQIYTDFLEPR